MPSQSTAAIPAAMTTSTIRQHRLGPPDIDVAPGRARARRTVLFVPLAVARLAAGWREHLLRDQ